MNSNKITHRINETSVRHAALVAGFGLVVIVITVIFAEFFVYPKLVVRGDAAETAQNIIKNKQSSDAGSIPAASTTLPLSVCADPSSTTLIQFQDKAARDS